MQYSEIRCPTCGTWRTALLGYSGEQICLTCGEGVGERGAEMSPAALSTGLWIDAAWVDGAELARERRREYIRSLASGSGVALADEAVEILALCRDASEVRFALPIVTLPTWVPLGERSFSDGNWTLRVQQPVGEHRAPFVLEGRGGSRPIVIHVERSRASDAPAPRREHVRTLELMAAGYSVLRIDRARAEQRGRAFRRAFTRDAVPISERGPSVRLAPRSEGGQRPRRVWARHELVYDATGLPLDERRELVEDWLRSRGEAPTPWQLDFLAHCDRAAEVHFALPFLRLPDAEPVDARTVHLGPWHTLRAQVPIDGYPLDFVFTTLLRESRELLSALIEIYPPRGPRDQMAEIRRAAGWRARGLDVIELAAAEARERGERWARTLLRELHRRDGQEAG